MASDRDLIKTIELSRKLQDLLARTDDALSRHVNIAKLALKAIETNHEGWSRSKECAGCEIEYKLLAALKVEGYTSSENTH